MKNTNQVGTTKRQHAIELFLNNDFKAALAIFKTFKIQVSKEEKRCLELAYAGLTGQSDFYSSIGVDTELELEKAKTIIKNKYIN